MGRGKQKRAAMRKVRMKSRNSIREKMGKRVFFTMAHCSKKLNGISNRYNYKANMHALCFVGARFFNVKYQASIITECNFRDSQFIGVDFYNCNLKGSSFKNAKLENVVFYNCKLNNVDFKDAYFANVIFICAKLDNAKNLNYNAEGITVLRSYPKLELDSDTRNALLLSADKTSVFDAKVLHVNKGKLNRWNLSIIQSRCGKAGLETLARILPKKEKWERLYTVYSYVLLIENWETK